MEKSTTKLLNKLFSTCGLPEDNPEPIGASFFPVGLSSIPLVQRAKMEKEGVKEPLQETPKTLRTIKNEGEIVTEKSKDTKDTQDHETVYICTRCGKDNLRKKDMTRDATASGGIKPICKVCTATRERELEEERKVFRVVLDFRKIKNGAALRDKLIRNAEDNCRTPAAEVFFMLKTAGFLCSDD